MSIAQADREKAIRLINSNKLSLWMLRHLPMAFFLRIKVKTCDGVEAETSMPFWWLSQNPFKSVYFAAQCAAAELSTGVLVIAATANDKRLSVLLAKIEAEYTKKATSRVTFKCEAGETIRNAVDEAMRTGEGRTVTAISTGYDEQGDVVSVSKLTWSFKRRRG